MTTDPLTEALALIRLVPDHPRPGILFRDITPVLGDACAFRTVVTALGTWAEGADLVAGVEARGFVLGAAVAQAVGMGFVPIRKGGKLPHDVVAQAYDLEYGQAELEIHVDAVPAGHRVLVVDDVLATGGTARAACGLVERVGGVVQGVAVLLELGDLGGRQRLDGWPVHALSVV